MKFMLVSIKSLSSERIRMMNEKMRSNNSIDLTRKLPSAGSIAVAIRTLAVLCSCLTVTAANNLRSTSHRRSKDNKENIAQNTRRSLQETSLITVQNYCGSSWVEANKLCSQPCPDGRKDHCPWGQDCYADLSSCPSMTIEAGASTTTTTTTSTSTNDYTASISTYESTSSFRCPEQHTGYYPISDCKSYYLCSGGAVADSLLYSCNDGLLFDIQKGRCDWETNVDCDAPYDPYPNNDDDDDDDEIVILELANGVTVSAQIGEPIYFPDYSRLQCIGEKRGDEKPSWMTSQHMFKSKERCCTEHFAWVNLNKCLGGDDFVEMNYLSVSATERPTALPTSRPTYPPKDRICDTTPYFSKDDTYITYDRVIADDDALYECLEPRGSSKCSAEGYEPGSGLYWVTAWKMIYDSLGCLPEPTSQPTSEPTVETANGLEDMTNWNTPVVLNNEEATSSEPTIEPTSKPSNKPSSPPTVRPTTNIPTTLMPTQPLPLPWYINYDLRTCFNDGKQPPWIEKDELYPSKEQCCSKYYEYDSSYSACIAQTRHPTLSPTVSPTPYPSSSPTLAGIQCAPPYTVGHPYKVMEEMSFNSYNYACFLPELCRDAQYAPRLSDGDVGKAWWRTDECVGMQTRHPTPLPTASPTKQLSTNNPTLESLELEPTQTLRWHVDYISRTCVIDNKQFGWIEEEDLYYSKEECCRSHFDNVRTYHTCITDGIQTRHGDNYTSQSKEVLSESGQADALSELGQPTPTPFLRSLPPTVRPTTKLTLEPTQSFKRPTSYDTSTHHVKS